MRVGVLTVVSVLSLSGVAAAETVEVTASGLNVRTGPSSRYRVIGVASRGQRLTVNGRSGNWVRVNFRGNSGYAYGRYLRTVSGSSRPTASRPSGTVMSVTANRLNVRSGPSTGYRRVGGLSRGTRVRVIGSSGVWKKIEYGSGTAWVHGSYLTTGTVSSGSTSGSSGSTSSGTSAGGPSRAGYIRLPASGRGFTTYYSSSRKWGVPRMIYGIQRVASRYIQRNPGASRVQVGDISVMNGGRISGHGSHRRGVDADFRMPSKNGREGPVTRFQSQYSRALTRVQLQLFEAELPVSHIFYNDPNISTRHKQYWRNHDNHYHVRVR